MSPVTFVIMIVLGIIMLSVPKRYAILPLLIGTCYISLGPRIVIAGADFTVTRIIILFGLIRLLNRSEYKYIVLSKLDKYLIVWVIVSIITGTINFGNISGFANRAGMAFDAFGFYFLIRSFLSEEKDIKALYYTIVILFIPLAFLMAIEKSTGRNPFGFFGGVNVISMIRDGKIRAQGPFAHAILAGTAGASILPYMISLWFEKADVLSGYWLCAYYCLFKWIKRSYNDFRLRYDCNAVLVLQRIPGSDSHDDFRYIDSFRNCHGISCMVFDC